MRSRLILFLTLIVTAACARMPQKAPPVAEQRYALEGSVVRLDAAAHTATIKHSDIADTATGKVWMKAMTMEFPVPDQGEFAKLKEGQRIRATVHRKELDYWIAEINQQ